MRPSLNVEQHCLKGKEHIGKPRHVAAVDEGPHQNNANRGLPKVAPIGIRHSSFKFAPKIVEKAPVGTLSYNPIWASFDETDLLQPQRVEPQRIFRVEVAPPVVPNLVQGLNGKVI